MDEFYKNPPFYNEYGREKGGKTRKGERYVVKSDTVFPPSGRDDGREEKGLKSEQNCRNFYRKFVDIF